MKKIVINSCYGGFGLSEKAVLRYAELKGMKLYTFDRDPDGSDPSYSTSQNEEDQKKDEYYFSPGDIPRDDPKLVQVVEELEEEANGRCAELEIVEIPKGVKWIISQYDGIETIEEEHRSWG